MGSDVNRTTNLNGPSYCHVCGHLHRLRSKEKEDITLPREVFFMFCGGPAPSRVVGGADTTFVVQSQNLNDLSVGH